MAIYDNWCNAQHCSDYIVWSFGYGNCISCKLQGESEHITEIPENCPFRYKLQDNSEYDYGHNVNHKPKEDEL